MSMNRAALTRVVSARVDFCERPLATPLVLSSGSITSVTEARAEVEARVGDRTAIGRGSIYLSELWAWPDGSIAREERAVAMQSACRAAAERLDELVGGDAQHPWELGLRLHACGVDDWAPTGATAAHALARSRWLERLDPRLPPLARIVCLSPFDAALHDAAGRAVERSAFQLYDEPVAIPAIDSWFPSGGACRALSATLRGSPRRVFPAAVVLGPHDDLETWCDRWVVERHYRRAKVKLLGQSLDDDVELVARVVDALRARGVDEPWLSLDANEVYASTQEVADLMDRLRQRDSVWRWVQYIEQPVRRNSEEELRTQRGEPWEKPLLLDEGLTSPVSLARAIRQGWSGSAIKTCKGHSFSLFVAAWSRERKLPCALADLTNPGYAALHAALFAAFVPTLNGLELNSPQFTPRANDGWLDGWSTLLDPQDGMHRLPARIPLGLGGEPQEGR